MSFGGFIKFEEIDEEIPPAADFTPQLSDPIVKISKAEGTVSETPKGQKIPITCGPLKALLHYDLFRCPGVREPCIEYHNEMITPRALCTLCVVTKEDRIVYNDWRRNIKIGKISLRQLLDRNRIKFINHDTECTGRCVKPGSKMPRSSKYRREPNDKRPNQTIPVENRTISKNTKQTHNKQVVNHQINNTPEKMRPIASNIYGGEYQRPYGATPGANIDPYSLNQLPIPANSGSFIEISQRFKMRTGPQAVGGNLDLFTDPSDFWGTIQELGLFEGIVSKLLNTFMLYKESFLKSDSGVKENAARQMSALISTMGLEDWLFAEIEDMQQKNCASVRNLNAQIEELKRTTALQEKMQEEILRKTKICERLFGKLK